MLYAPCGAKRWPIAKGEVRLRPPSTVSVWPQIQAASSEHSRHIGDVVRRTDALHGGVGDDVFFQQTIHFFAEDVCRVRVHKARIDTIDRNAQRG